MHEAGITGVHDTPKGLRHGFAVEALLEGPLVNDGVYGEYPDRIDIKDAREAEHVVLLGRQTFLDPSING